MSAVSVAKQEEDGAAQTTKAAKNKFKNFKAVCKEVLKKKGAASRT